MTDEQIKVAPIAQSLMDLLTDYWVTEIFGGNYDSATRAVIKALQSDGQYIVFAAPVGYRFGSVRPIDIGEKFPFFNTMTLNADAIEVTRAKGVVTLTLEPLTGGVK